MKGQSMFTYETVTSFIERKRVSKENIDCPFYISIIL